MTNLNPDLIFLQRMFGNCEFVSYDQQNRLSIPRHLREWANLRESEAAIIVGNGTRLEIWSRAGWDAYSNDFTDRKRRHRRRSHKASDRQSQQQANAQQPAFHWKPAMCCRRLIRTNVDVESRQ